MNFASTLKMLLDERGWSAAHLVAALTDLELSVSEWSVRQWLSGERNPRAEAVPVIARALGVTPNDLYGFGKADDAEPVPTHPAIERGAA